MLGVGPSGREHILSTCADSNLGGLKSISLICSKICKIPEGIKLKLSESKDNHIKQYSNNSKIKRKMKSYSKKIAKREFIYIQVPIFLTPENRRLGPLCK